jgi:hypothetical protein
MTVNDLRGADSFTVQHNVKPVRDVKADSGFCLLKKRRKRSLEEENITLAKIYWV